MGRRASLGFAAALVIVPAVIVAGYKHWLDTRTFEPLDIPISLSRGHVRTPDFYINLKGEFHAGVSVDYEATYTPGCREEAWRSLQTYTTAYENGVSIGETDGPRWGNIGVLSVDKKGYYSLDVEVLSDAARLNAAHPRLRIWNVSDFPYDDVFQLGTWFVLISVIAGLGLLIYTASVHATRITKGYVIVDSQSGAVTTGLPLRRLERRKLISSLPSFPLLCATLMALLIFIEAIFYTPVPSKGFYVSLNVTTPQAGDPNALMPPIIVRIRSTRDPNLTPELYVDSTTVQWNGLEDELKMQLRLRPQWLVYIDGDDNLDWRYVASAAGIAKELHAKVVLLTPETRRLVEPDLSRKGMRGRQKSGVPADWITRRRTPLSTMQNEK